MLLLEAHQYKSLRTLSLRTCVDHEKPKKDVGPMALETLEVASLACHQKKLDRMVNHTSARLLLQSLQTLKRLRLGFEDTLAKRCARWDPMVAPGPDFGRRTAEFVLLIHRINDTHMLPKAIRLEELSLCGMDLYYLRPEVSQWTSILVA